MSTHYKGSASSSRARAAYRSRSRSASTDATVSPLDARSEARWYHFAFGSPSDTPGTSIASPAFLPGWLRLRSRYSSRDASAVIALYVDGKGEIAARVTWPSSITLSAANDLTRRGYCTLRGQMRSFRLDRLLTCHPLTTPDDMQDAA